REATQPQARAQARAALDKARANAEIAEAALTRMQELEARGFVSRSDLDDAVNRRELARAELTSAEEQWSTLERQLTSQLQAAEARVAQA
ncbi:MAG: hypothetical protein GTN78_09400, partial [Gemmatimonadales bacterium]|nr:hypothetical protein [Gemmatimonadales bacterium]